MPKPQTNPETAQQAASGGNKPADTIRDGNLKCTIWRNEGEKGPWYAADLVRTFKTESGFKDTHSVPADDLLRVSHLAEKAYDRVLELKAQDKAAAKQPAGDEYEPY